MSQHHVSPIRRSVHVVCFAAIVAAVLISLAPSSVEASTKLWLYPDSDDPNSGGHVVTEPAFTLNIENRGNGVVTPPPTT